MSLRIIGYDAEGHRIVIDEGPNQAVIRGRGGLALGQALTATQVKPVGLVSPPRKLPGLRGESVLNRKHRP